MGERTYVLLHGAWHGGWCWRHVADALRAMGHRVVTPTQTGLGERRHLFSADITLGTFVDDLVNVMEAEELQDAVLVGHSFGGLAIAAVADRMPERVRHLVFLDSLIVESGQQPFDVLPAARVEGIRRAAAEQGGGVAIPPAPLAFFGIPENHPHAAWVHRRLTPHPLRTFESPLNLDNPVGNGRPCTYLVCTNPVFETLEACQRWARGRAGWNWREIATGHDAMVTAPEELARILASIV